MKCIYNLCTKLQIKKHLTLALTVSRKYKGFKSKALNTATTGLHVWHFNETSLSLHFLKKDKQTHKDSWNSQASPQPYSP